MKDKVPFKKEKLQGKILTAINSILRFKIADPELQFVTMTKVDLNVDSTIATVYWDSFNTSSKEAYTLKLDEVRGKIKSMLASYLSMRHAPDIIFLYDGQYEAEKSIEKILEDESLQGKSY